MAERDDELAATATRTQQRGPVTDYFGCGPRVHVLPVGDGWTARVDADMAGAQPARLALCRCVHGKEWPEGDNYESHGGKACAECSAASMAAFEAQHA